MNSLREELWDVSSDFQDHNWNTSGHLHHSPFFSSDTTPHIKVDSEDDAFSHSLSGPPVALMKEPKKRGRPKKLKDEKDGSEADGRSSEKKRKHDDGGKNPTVTKKRKDRFNGMPEEEVLQKLLPDHIVPNLDILIIGINPGLFASYVGHHYAGPGNHFWRCMFLSGLIPEPMSAYDDFKLISFGIGFTNICSRTTRGCADLKKQEIKEGAEILRKKLATYKPKVAVFNGKGIYEVFSGGKNFNLGKQPEKVEDTDTVLFVLPSSSVRCAQLPRAVDKVPYYVALKKLRDHLKGDLPTLDESEIVFPALETKPKAEVKDDASDDDEDSRLSCGDSSSREMTLEQIQNQTEYIEALIASAEGKEFPMDSCGDHAINFMKFRRGDNTIDTETSGSGDEVTQLYTPQIHNLKPINNPQTAKIFQSSSSFGSSTPVMNNKKEVLYDDSEYEVVAVNGPTAHMVNLDDSVEEPYQHHLSATPHYLSLGDLPSKIGPSSSPTCTNIKQQSFLQTPQAPGPHTSSGFAQAPTPHTSSGFAQAPGPHTPSGFAQAPTPHTSSGFAQAPTPHTSSGFSQGPTPHTSSGFAQGPTSHTSSGFAQGPTPHTSSGFAQGPTPHTSSGFAQGPTPHTSSGFAQGPTPHTSSGFAQGPTPHTSSGFSQGPTPHTPSGFSQGPTLHTPSGFAQSPFAHNTHPCPTQSPGPRTHVKNGSSFSHNHSRTNNTHGKIPVRYPAYFLNA